MSCHMSLFHFRLIQIHEVPCIHYYYYYYYMPYLFNTLFINYIMLKSALQYMYKPGSSIGTGVIWSDLRVTGVTRWPVEYCCRRGLP